MSLLSRKIFLFHVELFSAYYGTEREPKTGKGVSHSAQNKERRKKRNNALFRFCSKEGMIAVKKLSALLLGEEGTVENVLTEGAMRRRFQELGVVPGTTVLCLQKSFFGDIKAYLIKDAVIAIRDEDADGIIIY